MAGRIREEDVLAVKERVSLADVVGERVTLRSAGAGRLKGLCPFHEEKTPSFTVNTALGFYHCFGCGQSGDVIAFLREAEQLTFAEAVERLAARAGVSLRYEGQGTGGARIAGERMRLVRANEDAAAFFAEQLAASEEARIARSFLAERGFDAEVATRFGAGYAPRGWDVLLAHLRARRHNDNDLLVAGLVAQGSRGVYDRFRGRLVWPIRNPAGEVLGFGARRLHDDDDGPKYLNTPETPLYRKSQVLYAVELAKRDIARSRQVVLVEGYTDVMACHLAGVPTAVATCGTAFGEEHIKVLRRLLVDDDEFGGEIIFTFDGDEAGQKAALRAFEDEARFVAQTFVAVEPSGLDPCDLRRMHGDAAVRRLVASRVPLFEFVIRSILRRHHLDTPEGRVAALRASAPLVAGIRDRSLRPEYTRTLAGWLGMEIEPVARAVRQAERGEPAKRQSGASTAPPLSGRSEERPAAPDGRPGTGATGATESAAVLVVQREALKIAIQAPDLVGTAFDALPEGTFSAAKPAAVADAIRKAGGTAHAVPGPAWVESVLAASADDTVRGVVRGLAVEPMRSGSPTDRYAAEILARLEESVVDRQVAELRSRLQRLDATADATELATTFANLVALEQRRRVLRDRALGT